jgi:hypothetical protein
MKTRDALAAAAEHPQRASEPDSAPLPMGPRVMTAVGLASLAWAVLFDAGFGLLSLL